MPLPAMGDDRNSTLAERWPRKRAERPMSGTLVAREIHVLSLVFWSVYYYFSHATFTYTLPILGRKYYYPKSTNPTMKFTRLIAITALFSISGSAKSTVLRGPNAEITLDESSRDKHMPAEDQRFLNGCDPKCTGGMEYEACKKMDQSKVGCGSCLGDHACSEAKGESSKLIICVTLF